MVRETTYPNAQIVRWITWAMIGLLLLGSGMTQVHAAAAATSTADVVVQFGNGEVVVKRISFEGTISGLEALRKTGLTLVEKDTAVCRIGDTGCGASEECFCACPSPYTSCLFWQYQQWDGKAWIMPEDKGAAGTTVSNGAVEGWTWGRTLPAVAPARLGAEAGLQWLLPQQATDGGFASGNVGLTIDSLLANRALGGDAATTRRTGGASLLDAVRSKAPAYAAQGAAAVGKLALAAAAADLDPRSFGGLNLVISTTATLNQSTGAYGSTNWDQAYAMLGLRAAGETVPASAVTLLKSRANSDGSWPYASPDTGDVDSTGLMVQALVAAGVPASDTAITKALTYLDNAQNNDGGFPYQPASNGSDASNVNSTALAVQGILAAGADPLATRWKPSTATAVDYMLAQQLPNGAFTYSGQASLLATQQAIPALAGRTFLVSSRAVAQRKALGFIAAQQKADGSFNGFGTGSTIDAVLAIDAAGGNPQQVVSTEGKKPLDFLATKAAAYAATSAAAGGKLMTGIVAAGADPRSFGGLNLVISTTLRYDAKTGAYGSSTYDQAWSILGLAAAGEHVPISATAKLEAMASKDGGWGFGANDAAPDPDSTGLALMALAAGDVVPGTSTSASQASSDASLCATGAGSNNATVLAALAFLRAKQNKDGGFPGYDGSTSASSTGLALQGLAAYGDHPRSLTWTTMPDSLREANPLDTLIGLQNASGGFPGYSGASDPDATYQALPGVLGVPFPASVRTLIRLPFVVK